MARLEKPKGLNITFRPSERQYELWNALQPNRCDKCGGSLAMMPNGFDKSGHQVYRATCVKCGNTDIPEQVLGGGSAGGGKALLLNELVCTPDGFKQVGELNLGDVISNPMTGGCQKIIWLHPIEEHEYFRVKFEDGTHVDCSEGHLWRIYKTQKTFPCNKLVETINSDSVWSTKEMFEWFCGKKLKSYEDSRLLVPLTKPIQFAQSDNSLPIHPYILGLLIACGYTTEECIELYNIDQYIIDKLNELGCSVDVLYETSNKPIKICQIRDKKIIDRVNDLNIYKCTYNSKFIPEIYKYAKIEDRKHLICGIIDVFGNVTNKGYLSYTTLSKKLAGDIAFICRSLGAKCSVVKYFDKYLKNDAGLNKRDVFKIKIEGEINTEFVSLPQKKQIIDHIIYSGNNLLGKAIVDINRIGKQKGRCISVSDPSGLYVTNRFNVTHNSYIGCCWLTLSCMQFEGIRMVVARKVRKTLLETTWKTLRNVLNEWGLVQDVNYHVNNVTYTITFWNGSEIMAMDLTPSPQDPDFNSLGSLEITGGFIDEVSEVSEKAVEVLASRIRYRIAESFIVGKLFMSTNPCLTWVRSTFVMDDDGNPVELQNGYRYIPFSLFDNPNEQFRAIYYNKLKQLRNKADRDRLLYGNWLFTTSNKMAAYWNFDGDKHIVQNLKEAVYDPMRPLILSFDFNVNPYMSCLPIQIDYDNKIVRIFPEYVGYPKDKRNNTPSFTKWVASQIVCDGHLGGVLITGDPAGLARSTQTEEGVNNFTIANKNMSNAVLSPKIQLLTKQPAMVTRLEFINELFLNYKGWKIEIDARCHRLIEDFVYQKKNPDGTKEKKKTLNENGEKVERYGHFSDCFDYALIYYLSKEYSDYRTNTSDIVTTIRMDEAVYGDFDY